MELSSFFDDDGKVLLFSEAGTIKFDFPPDECPIRAMIESPSNYGFEIEISDVIAEDEIDSLCVQISSSLALDRKKLSNGIILIDEKYLSEQEHGGLFTSYQVISNPAFSRDGLHAIVYSATHCGIECGGGGLVILKKTNRKWEKIAYFMLWIS